MKGTAQKVEMSTMQTLKDSELRHRRLFQAAEDGLLILDVEMGMIGDINLYFINILDYSREELVEKKLWEEGAFKDIEASQNVFGALQENEFIRYKDFLLIRYETTLGARQGHPMEDFTTANSHW
jgi:PAS domain-containing protein